MENKQIKSGFVTIIGLPNAGKSTFLNAVIKENIAITSKRPQTTRKNLKGIYNDEDSQIVFVDTPGIHKGKNKLDEYMDMSIRKALDDIDLMIVIVDIVTYGIDDFDRLNSLIGKSKTKKILLLNKTDLIDELELTKIQEDILSKIDKKVNFENVFFVSSLKKKSIREVIDTIKKLLPLGERFYDEDDLTDEPTKQIVADMIRQQCLYKLDKEIPHGIAVVVDAMKMSKSKCMNIDATIVCEKDTHKGIIIGKGGAMIKNIGTGARIAIEKFLVNKVNLKLNVIVKENWRDERTLLSNFGFEIKNI